MILFVYLHLNSKTWWIVCGEGTPQGAHYTTTVVHRDWHPVGNSDEEPKEKPAILCTIQVKTSRHWIDNSRTRAGEPARLILLVCVLRIYVYIVCVCVCVSCVLVCVYLCV